MGVRTFMATVLVSLQGLPKAMIREDVGAYSRPMPLGLGPAYERRVALQGLLEMKDTHRPRGPQ